MADYNASVTAPQWQGTRLVPRAGVLERIATNGAVRLRALYSAVKYDPVIVHGFMTAAQRTALLNFYAANRTATFTFTATEDGVTRTCVFAANPFTIEPMPDNASLFQATVNLREA